MSALQRVDTGAAVEAAETPDGLLPVHQLPGQFSREQIDLIKRTVAEGTSDDELALFLEVCKSSGLNPFQRQIYAIVRQESYKDDRGQWAKRNKMTIQTGIDGYRLIAARTGQHAGTEDAVFGPEDEKGNPAWARVTLYRFLPNGHKATFTATARWNEYAQKTRDGKMTGLWGSMPYGQLAKCAESLALRRAFPAELAGLYTKEEMAQATVEDADVVEVGPARPARRPGLTPREERGDFPGEDLYAGPRPATPVEVHAVEAAPAPDPDAIAEALEARLMLVDTADRETLRRWYAEARDGEGYCAGWPGSLRKRLAAAITEAGKALPTDA